MHRSPVLLRPLEHGADFVLHSGTKILSGHHDVSIGAVACASADAAARLAAFRNASGIVAAPDPAWLLLRGVKTLALRVERQSAGALEISRRLAEPGLLRLSVGLEDVEDLWSDLARALDA
jgi:cystathionine gamma-synthase